jgi:hypothetical protein
MVIMTDNVSFKAYILIQYMVIFPTAHIFNVLINKQLIIKHFFSMSNKIIKNQLC